MCGFEKEPSVRRVFLTFWMVCSVCRQEREILAFFQWQCFQTLNPTSSNGITPHVDWMAPFVSRADPHQTPAQLGNELWDKVRTVSGGLQSSPIVPCSSTFPIPPNPECRCTEHNCFRLGQDWDVKAHMKVWSQRCTVLNPHKSSHTKRPKFTGFKVAWG